MARSAKHLKEAKERQAKNAAKKANKSSPSISSTPKLPKAPKAPSFKSFNFDATLPTAQYTAEANSLYNPQIAQIGNIRNQSTAAAEAQKVTTKKQFADLLQNTIETINRRGAFFSGGAVNQENQINADQNTALTGIDTALQNNLNDLASKEAAINIDKMNYIKSGVQGAQSSAYSQFQDQLNNAMDLYKTQLSLYSDAKSQAIAQANADRNYALDVAQANKPEPVKTYKPVDPNTYWKPEINKRTGQQTGWVNSYTQQRKDMN